LGVSSNAESFADGVQHWSTYHDAQQRVVGSLLDPGSAQVRDLFIHKGTDGDYVCGQVNARNRMGGYVGYRWFYVHLNDVVIQDDDEAKRTWFGAWCGTKVPFN